MTIGILQCDCYTVMAQGVLRTAREEWMMARVFQATKGGTAVGEVPTMNNELSLSVSFGLRDPEREGLRELGVTYCTGCPQLNF